MKINVFIFLIDLRYSTARQDVNGHARMVIGKYVKIKSKLRVICSNDLDTFCDTSFNREASFYIHMVVAVAILKIFLVDEP